MIGGASFWFPHTVSIRARRSGGGMGPGHGAAVASIAEVVDKRELIRDANGREVISNTRVTVPLSTEAPLGSLVTVWPDRPDIRREATVLQVGRDENGPPLPSHLILWLT